MTGAAHGVRHRGLGIRVVAPQRRHINQRQLQLGTRGRQRSRGLAPLQRLKRAFRSHARLMDAQWGVWGRLLLRVAVLHAGSHSVDGLGTRMSMYIHRVYTNCVGLAPKLAGTAVSWQGAGLCVSAAGDCSFLQASRRIAPPAPPPLMSVLISRKAT